MKRTKTYVLLCPLFDGIGVQVDWVEAVNMASARKKLRRQQGSIPRGWVVREESKLHSPFEEVEY